jgi:hypothetical protein
MVNDHNHDKSIDGSEIIQTTYGPYTGDVNFTTRDGRQWRKLEHGVPNTLATGDVIKTVTKTVK